ncbi:MAG TPA: hypothetical protein VFQ72_02385 [Candidatus Paceibacterota bacterium]|nr:hypothetical protein [Candidatus Paceibacterota bacterium]
MLTMYVALSFTHVKTDAEKDMVRALIKLKKAGVEIVEYEDFQELAPHIRDALKKIEERKELLLARFVKKPVAIA